MMTGKVVIVDDNRANLKLARVVLSLEGLDVRTALSAEEALTVLESFTPDLILMDLQLPGIDGLQLTRQLKTDPARRDIIILAVTAYAMKGDMEKALAAGCDGYISKPFDPPMLCSLVQQHLQQKRPATCA
ncbi:MAG TPA: response regulator [Candidatus Binataceae bacterium]|nr:response regulator [Candidatus Binataceae bacterium]